MYKISDEYEKILLYYSKLFWGPPEAHSIGVHDYSSVALRKVSRKLTVRGGVSISDVPCLPCLIGTIPCSYRCMLTLYCLIVHLIVISLEELYCQGVKNVICRVA